MQITHLGHAAVLVQTAGARVLIDPGNLDPAWHDLTDLDAVLITHQHPDHVDADAVPALLAANPRAELWLEPSVPEAVPALATGTGAWPGETFNVGDLRIEVVGGRHAIIHPDLPRFGNVGYVLRAEGEPTLFHPGDAYDTAPDGIDLLALPAYGPWAAMKETVDFARVVGAPQGFPIHDGLLNDRGRALVISRVSEMSPTQLDDLRAAGPRDY